ncbi:uncharacterized protein LOC132400298 [Hypanus sabinus]|uniref:uncharacterized protein LOC132400298 n=1 Tax=Hypanus sabinus TaxID=79690 RepID=UPI0028C4D8C5|nr:uncharacterized protein LOC132400298 [Hypanus sabinus]
MVNQIAQYKVYSTIDLKSAYHQLPIRPQDCPYTTFEAGGRLYHFLRVPFGVTNGVSVFQRKMDQIVDQYQLKATFPYLNNITICGHDWPDHNANLQRFLQVAAALNLTYNRDKCVFGTTRLAILGKSVTGTTLPVWLTTQGPVLHRKLMRSTKYSPLVERVHLLHANPQYAYVVLPDGREDTVSIRDLAPAGAADHYPEHSPVTMNPVLVATPCSPGPTQTPHKTYIPGVSYAYISGTCMSWNQHNLHLLCNHQCRQHLCNHSRCYVDRSDRFDHLIDLTCKKLRHMGTLLNKVGVNVVNCVCLSGHVPC